VEFFVCPCKVTARVILDGKDQGPNKDAAGKLRTIQCNAGLHSVSLQGLSGKAVTPAKVKVAIKNTDPISPMEVPFECP
jgi:hypothetical protein